MTSTEQKRIINALSEADLALRKMKATIKKEVRERVEKELESAQIRRDLLAYQAREAKIPVTVISREGLHTSATITAYKAIGNGERYAAPANSPTLEFALSKEFAWEDKLTLRVTPVREDITPLLHLLGLELDDFDANEDLRSALFAFDPQEERLEAVTPAFDPAFGRHPVVALVLGEAPEFRARAIAWAINNVDLDAASAAA